MVEIHVKARGDHAEVARPYATFLTIQGGRQMKRKISRFTAVFMAFLSCSLVTGCQMFGNSDCNSAGSVPNQASAPPKSSRMKLNFLQLRQDPPAAYLLAPGDVLGVFIEGVTGDESTPPPVNFPEDKSQDPSVGYPIPIRDDGRISLPLLGPIYISGATIAEAEEKIRDKYTAGGILQPGRDRIIVTLMRRRHYNITVIREDADSVTIGGGGGLLVGSSKKGKTHSIDLPAYENDVLHALSESGGLPGEDAKNEIVILRGMFEDAQRNPYLMAQLLDADRRIDVVNGSNITRIPIRVGQNEIMPRITQDDIILEDGDVVLIEGRDTEFFYTGGLLDGAQHPIPRDYDLDVLGAIAIAGGSLSTSPGGSSGTLGSFGGGGGRGSNLMPASRIRVLRTINGRATEIELNLREIVRNNDIAQRILIQPGDVVLLEYRPTEVLVNTGVTVFTAASFGFFQ